MVLILDGKDQSLLFDLLKAFALIESSHKSDLIPPKRPIFLPACAKCSELPSYISTMGRTGKVKAGNPPSWINTGFVAFLPRTNLF